MELGFVTNVDNLNKKFKIMERAKKLVEEIRENCRLIQTKVEALQSEGVELTVAVGTNSKTVEFNKVEVLEINIKATVNQDL